MREMVKCEKIRRNQMVDSLSMSDLYCDENKFILEKRVKAVVWILVTLALILGDVFVPKTPSFHVAHGLLEGVVSGLIIYFMVVFYPNWKRRIKNLEYISRETHQLFTWINNFEEKWKKEAELRKIECQLDKNLGHFQVITTLRHEEEPLNPDLKKDFYFSQVLNPGRLVEILEDAFNCLKSQVSNLERCATINSLSEIDINLMMKISEMDNYLHAIVIEKVKFESKELYADYFSHIQRTLKGAIQNLEKVDVMIRRMF